MSIRTFVTRLASTVLMIQLAAAENAAPVLTVPETPTVWEAPGRLQLTATVSDDGQPLPANPGQPDPEDPHRLRWNWSVVSLPAASGGVVWSGQATQGAAFTYAGSANTPGTVFTCAPTADFDVPGRYVLAFTATDGELSVSREVMVLVKTSSEFRERGYEYLSPLPGSEYASPQTRFVLVRFSGISPLDVTNLATFIAVSDASGAVRPGQTRIADDGRTVIFQTFGGFPENKPVTVRLTPGVRAGAPGTVEPYEYQFVVSGPIPDGGLVSARGDNPPAQTMLKAFDGRLSTQWADLIVPDGQTNFSWIQSAYPGEETRVVNQYAITSAQDAPGRDPEEWRFYGVDLAGELTLLDTQTGQTFNQRLQRKSFAITNPIAFRAYRLEIRKVKDPGSASGVQLAELEFLEPVGSILWEYWTGIPGTAVSNLTSFAGYPDQPTGKALWPQFEGPSGWFDLSGTRMRGYITAPNTGSFLFWLAADETAELWLSTDADPLNKRLIASVPSPTYRREWTRFAAQRSAPIPLLGGQKYYAELLQKEAFGDDHAAVGWAKPGQTTALPSEIIPGSVLSPWIGDGFFAGPDPGGRVGPGEWHADPKLTGETGGEEPDSTGPGVAKLFGLNSRVMPNGVSVPSDFPQVEITVNQNPAPGHIFLQNPGSTGINYVMILDNDGSPVWYRRQYALDFKVQRNGMITWAGASGFDQNFKFIQTYPAANGYGTDFHDFKMLADSGYLIVGNRLVNVDMTHYLAGSSAFAQINATVIQEFTSAGELVFQWRGWDNYDVRDARGTGHDPRAGYFSFPHINAVDVDTDGHLLASCRNVSEVTKINRNTGQVIWRLGGVKSDFTFLNDSFNGFSCQHDISALGNGRYMVFDNGTYHTPRVSRAAEYQLDLTNRTATLVWEYRDTPDQFTDIMGNAQRLPNGHTLMNFVQPSNSKVLEVDRNGVKQFVMNLTPHSQLYRSFRFPWNGVVAEPYLIAEPYPDRVTLVFNKFGDRTVDHYRIYGGTAPAPTTLLATSKTTLFHLKNVVNGVRNYFRVTAVSTNGVESPYSNEESLMLNIVMPGENMILNGNFATGTNSWVWALSNSATAGWRITNGAAFIDVTNASSQLSDVQLRQAGMKLVQGREYVLEFDAWAPQPRVIEARLGQDQPPFANYKLATPSLTPALQHFTYPFAMTNATDLNARLAFNFGASTRDVYLDNVSLWMVIPGDFNRDGCVNYADLQVLTAQWLRQGTGLAADLNGDGRVDFHDLAILGENWTGGNCP